MAYICYPAVLTAHGKGEQWHDPSSPSLYDLALYAESRNFTTVNAWTRRTAAANDTHAATAVSDATTDTDAAATITDAAAAAAATISASWGSTNHQMCAKRPTDNAESHSESNK